MNIPPVKRCRQIKSQVTSNVYHALLDMGGYGTDYAPMEIERDLPEDERNSYGIDADVITICQRFSHTQDGGTHEAYYTTTIHISTSVDDKPPE